MSKSQFLILVAVAACGDVNLNRHIEDAPGVLSDSGSGAGSGSGSGSLHLTVTLAGDGLGVITSTPAGISCGTTCAYSFDEGQTITLTAAPSTVPATASKFIGWTGGCTGTGACMVTDVTTVTATFTLAPNIMFASSTATNGNLGGIVGADQTCNTLAATAGIPGTYVAYLSMQSGNTIVNAPQRVGAATGWVRPDGRPIMKTVDQLAAGTVTNAPSLMENGVDVTQTQYPYAWTGTQSTGTYNSQCSTSNVVAPWGGVQTRAVVGLATATDATVVQNGVFPCDVLARIYCLGIDRRSNLP